MVVEYEQHTGDLYPVHSVIDTGSSFCTLPRLVIAACQFRETGTTEDMIGMERAFTATSYLGRIKIDDHLHNVKIMKIADNIPPSVGCNAISKMHMVWDSC